MLRLMGATDRGLVRAVNEDRFAGEVFSPDFAYGVVCDGLGGENAGGVASDIACEEIRRMLGPGWGLRPRFSPGYGDFPLEYQRELLGVLDAAKRIGLTLTDSLLMAPSKSVTAVIGVYEAADMPGGCGRGEDLTGRGAHGCAGCGKEDCAYRRN